MTRVTKKANGINGRNYIPLSSFGWVVDQDFINKMGRIEDAEEEFKMDILDVINKLNSAIDKACRNMETLEQIVYSECESYREQCVSTLSAQDWKEWILK